MVDFSLSRFLMTAYIPCIYKLFFVSLDFYKFVWVSLNCLDILFYFPWTFTCYFSVFWFLTNGLYFLWSFDNFLVSMDSLTCFLAPLNLTHHFHFPVLDDTLLVFQSLTSFCFSNFYQHTPLFHCICNFFQNLIILFTLRV